MRRLVQFVPGLILATCCACMDSAGNRTTMQEWWQSRSGQRRTDSLADARSARREEKASTDKVEPEARDPDPHGTNGAPPAGPRPEPHTTAAEAPPNAIRSEGLIVDDETIRVEDILEPVQSRLPTMSADLPPDVYWRKVGELIRQHIIEAVAQHLIWRRAHQQM